MAKVKSIIQFSGSLHDLCFYHLNGQPIVRTIGRITRERYKSDPEFARMRENMTEFGAASHIGKTIREMFAPYSKTHAGPYISGRLNAVVKQMISNGSGERGKRTFEVLPYKSLLTGFEFHPRYHFNKLFQVPYSLTTHAARNEVKLIIDSPSWTQLINAPEPATHFRLICTIGCLSDYHFTGEKYEPVYPDLNGLHAVEVSVEIPLEAAHNLVLNPQLPGSQVLDSKIGLICCLGIEFLQKKSEVFYVLEQGRCMGVVGVFK